MRVLAAMSGGVDSAVAAARAVGEGHDVVGVHLALAKDRSANRVGSRGCCTIEDATDARRVADLLGIPFYVWDMAERFEKDVVEDFISEYAAGRTPNPCMRCNERIKFSALLDKALALGFDAVATGHYAALTQTEDGPVLARAADRAKDQSYVLAVVKRNRLRQAMFPLGDVPDKAAVRGEADALGLGVAAKPDSHDICFIPDGNTRGWLEARVERSCGDIVDLQGEVVGQHDGAAGYTIGQRRGLRLGRPAADGEPRYVVDVSVVTNTLTVGPAKALKVRGIITSEPIWHGPVPEAGTQVLAQVRAHGRGVPVTVVSAGGERRLQVQVDDELVGVANGQSLVLYDADNVRVLGAATIEETW